MKQELKENKGLPASLLWTLAIIAGISVAPYNYEARAEIMWASSLAHNGLTGCGGIGDWSTHQLEHREELLRVQKGELRKKGKCCFLCFVVYEKKGRCFFRLRLKKDNFVHNKALHIH